MSSSVSTSIDIFSAVAGGLIMIKGSKILHSLNNELSWYDDYLSLLIGGMGVVSVWRGIHCIAIKAGLQKWIFVICSSKT